MNLEQMMAGMGRMPDQQLQKMLQGGAVPQFLVASELQKRKTMRERAAQMPPTVAEDLQQPTQPPPMQGSSLPPDVVQLLQEANARQPQQPPPGMRQGGQVNTRHPVTGRPILNNPDGSFSTEESATVEADSLNQGRPTNIPTIYGGRRFKEETAINKAAGSGKAYPSFDSIEEAEYAARKRSEMLGRTRYTDGGQVRGRGWSEAEILRRDDLRRDPRFIVGAAELEPMPDRFRRAHPPMDLNRYDRHGPISDTRPRWQQIQREEAGLPDTTYSGEPNLPLPPRPPRRYADGGVVSPTGVQRQQITHPFYGTPGPAPGIDLTPYNVVPKDLNPTTARVDTPAGGVPNQISPTAGYPGDGAGSSSQGPTGGADPTGTASTGNIASDIAGFGTSALGVGLNATTASRGISGVMGGLVGGVPGAIGAVGQSVVGPAAALGTLAGAAMRGVTESMGYNTRSGIPGIADVGPLSGAIANEVGIGMNNAFGYGAQENTAVGVGPSKDDTAAAMAAAEQNAGVEGPEAFGPDAPAAPTAEQQGFAPGAEGMVGPDAPNAGGSAGNQAGPSATSADPNGVGASNSQNSGGFGGEGPGQGQGGTGGGGMASSQSGSPGGSTSGGDTNGTNLRGGGVVRGYIPSRYATGEEEPRYMAGGIPLLARAAPWVWNAGRSLLFGSPLRTAGTLAGAGTAAYMMPRDASVGMDRGQGQYGPPAPAAPAAPPRPAARPSTGGGGGGGALPPPPPEPPGEQQAQPQQQQQRQQPQEESRGMSPLQLAMIQAGLGMMSSSRKNPLAALGDQAKPAAETYLAADRTQTDDLRRRQEAMMRSQQHEEQMRRYDEDRQSREALTREGHQNQMAIAGMRGAGRGGGTPRAARPDTAMITSVARQIAANAGRTSPSPVDLAAARRVVANPALLDRVTSVGTSAEPE